MKYTVEDLRKSISRLNHYERLADEREQAYEADPMNEDREQAFDAAYETEYNEYVFALQILQNLISCTREQAQYILRKDNRDRVNDLFARLA